MTAPTVPAPLWRDPSFVYHPADSHSDASLFRARTHARLIAAQPNLRAANEREQHREAA